MPSQVRERMIAGALELLSRRGLQATSFAEVTQATQTPRGSIYHHFPGGKQELVLAALDRQAALWRETIDALPQQSPEKFVAYMLDRVREAYAQTDFAAGSAVGAVTIGAENPEQLDRCAATFAAFIDAMKDGLVRCGVEPTTAHDFASLTLQTLAGSTILARATRKADDFEIAVASLCAQAAQLPLAGK